MSRKVSLVTILFVGVAMLGLVGLALAASLTRGSTDPAPATKAGGPTGQEGLHAADRAAADKQKTCPVSNNLLGSMGTPIKVTVKGRDVYLCCAGCKAKFLKDPDTYLAKLAKQAQK